ncbi:mediator complex subunit Srb7 [Schizosaccharomyces cryophilus OY26]|uniref:Mediator of RNA polymerase II transcription subunit 21 n=1 Tax=Schizosaccharomyces cryophilus (strain OY26 / ATCC MYA-4695 / CBS 11777 / NBRC 106824 / NRRL Y48691) TaxID=653667 RepID=S9W123_SCHCR|nr:mediator complex subunit Srb7 [Schizosaccharomyces cryophilus OY26]EPY53608.1 mediator complex subunit Srb7 [Schizosaccharomyces cryophilus OY26]
MSCCTQLQDTIDEVTTQFYSSIHYMSAQHDFVPLPGQEKASDAKLNPVSEEDLKFVQKDMAKDLVTKFQQIGTLIQQLPGISTAPKHQMEKIKSLQKSIEEKKKERENCEIRNEQLKASLAQRIETFGQVTCELFQSF